MVFQALNRLKWQGLLARAEITIIHRGAPGDRMLIEGSSITELKKSYFCYQSGGRETHIPLHRVVEIRLDGKLIWSRPMSRIRKRQGR